VQELQLFIAIPKQNGCCDARLQATFTFYGFPNSPPQRQQQKKKRKEKKTL